MSINTSLYVDMHTGTNTNAYTKKIISKIMIMNKYKECMCADILSVLNTHKYTCIYVYKICAYVNIYVYIYTAYADICVYIYISVYIYTNTCVRKSAQQQPRTLHLQDPHSLEHGGCQMWVASILFKACPARFQGVLYYTQLSHSLF